MDLVDLVLKVMSEQPTALPLIIMTFWLGRETIERKELQKVNFKLQERLLAALNDAKSAAAQGNALLQMIMTMLGNGKRR